jgi:hypothetical protein
VRQGKINAALSVMEEPRMARAVLVHERKLEVATLAALQAERAAVYE